MVKQEGYTCPTCGKAHKGTYMDFMNRVCKQTNRVMTDKENK